jgi:predicted phage tail protein
MLFTKGKSTVSIKRKIFLHGYLHDLHSEAIEVEADTVAEALRVLSLIPALHREDGQPHLVEVRGIETDIALYSRTDFEEIHVYPRMGGDGGRGGLMQILLGVVLIAVAVAFPAGIAMLGTTIGTSGMFLTGTLMLLGGVLQALMPTPEAAEQGPASRYLGSVENTVRIGTRIPLVYGSRRVGGHYLSFDVDSVEVGGVDNDSPDSNDIIPGGSLFKKYDASTPPAALAPINPVYASATTGPSNPPISSWSSTG